MIRRCGPQDLETMYEIVNEAAQVYRGVIPADRWEDPYMPMAELQGEIADGVEFWGMEAGEELAGIMGLQDKCDVALIRHAYVRPSRQRQGIGAALLAHLLSTALMPVLIGTWAAAAWAISFYEKHGFRCVTSEEKDRLLHRYWRIPERQVDTSVVLADARWFRDRFGDKPTSTPWTSPEGVASGGSGAQGWLGGHSSRDPARGA